MGDQDDSHAAVQCSIEALNRGDAGAMAAAFAPQGSILDGMAPHLWIGPMASRYRGALAEGKRHGASQSSLSTSPATSTPGTPRMWSGPQP